MDLLISVLVIAVSLVALVFYVILGIYRLRRYRRQLKGSLPDPVNLSKPVMLTHRTYQHDGPLYCQCGRALQDGEQYYKFHLTGPNIHVVFALCLMCHGDNVTSIVEGKERRERA